MIRVCVSTIRKFMNRSHEEDLLQLLYIHRKAPLKDIAKYLNCSVESVKEKLIKYDMMQPNGKVTPGTFIGVFTGRFHYAKADLIAAISAISRVNKVVKRTDEIYMQTKSVNARILKDIIDEMNELDDDRDELSAGAALGMTRKETWQAGAHFGIALYDVDMLYSERIDYLIKRIIERRGEFYFDQHSDPKNWYPHRDKKLFNEYIVGRTFGAKALREFKESGGTINMQS